MLELRPDCERCGADLPAHLGGAFICSFECTFCAQCAEALDEQCPNCGGELLDRPTRAPDLLAKYPASTERRHKACLRTNLVIPAQAGIQGGVAQGYPGSPPARG